MSDIPRKTKSSLLSLPASVLDAITSHMSTKDIAQPARACRRLQDPSERRIWATLKLGHMKAQQAEAGDLCSDLLTLNDLLLRRPSRIKAIRRIQIFHPCPDDHDGDEVLPIPPLWSSAYDRNMAWSLSPLRSLPRLPACQALAVSDVGPQVLLAALDIMPNLRELNLDQYVSSGQSPASFSVPLGFHLGLTRFVVDIHDPASLDTTLEIIKITAATLETLAIDNQSYAVEDLDLSPAVVHGLTAASPGLAALRTLSIPAAWLPGDDVLQALTRISVINFENDELAGPPRSQAKIRIPARPALRHLSIENDFIDLELLTRCCRTVAIDSDLLHDIKGAPTLAVIDRVVSHKAYDDRAEIRELICGSSESLYHIVNIRGKLSKGRKRTDLSSYRGFAVPLDILRMIYKRAGIDMAAYTEERKIHLASGSFDVLDEYLRVMGDEAGSEKCQACG